MMSSPSPVQASQSMLPPPQPSPQPPPSQPNSARSASHCQHASEGGAAWVGGASTLLTC